MADEPLYEGSFLIPVRRDANLSEGQVHRTELWEWLAIELFVRFEGATQSPGVFRGFYRDPNTGEPVDDESQKFTVALPESRLDELKEFLQEACELFEQKCIYLSIAGRVEFVWKSGLGPSG